MAAVNLDCVEPGNDCALGGLAVAPSDLVNFLDLKRTRDIAAVFGRHIGRGYGLDAGTAEAGRDAPAWLI